MFVIKDIRGKMLCDEDRLLKSSSKQQLTSSSCNVLYINTLKKQGLHHQDLDPCDDISLLVFNDFLTRLCGVVNLPLSLGEGEDERKVTLCFLAV